MVLLTVTTAVRIGNVQNCQKTLAVVVADDCHTHAQAGNTNRIFQLTGSNALRMGRIGHVHDMQHSCLPIVIPAFKDVGRFAILHYQILWIRNVEVAQRPGLRRIGNVQNMQAGAIASGQQIREAAGYEHPRSVVDTRRREGRRQHFRRFGQGLNVQPTRKRLQNIPILQRFRRLVQALHLRPIAIRKRRGLRHLFPFGAVCLRNGNRRGWGACSRWHISGSRSGSAPTEQTFEQGRNRPQS